MRVLVLTEDIGVLAAAIGQHGPESVWWYANFSRASEGEEHGLVRGNLIASHVASKEDIVAGFDKVMKAMPRSFTPSKEGGADESE
tara:strand:- start:10751 stop:11008 length:258 start_codon:yes stop_codon:yes gene_type:complete